MATTTEPTREDVATWRRRFAVEANNKGWSLVELADRTAGQTDEMLDAAHASAHLWSEIGTELNRARGYMLLGFAHGLAGDGNLAKRYARMSLDYFTAHDCPDWEIAFAHAGMACAASAVHDAAMHAGHYAEARRLADRIANPEDRAIFMKTFDRIPAP
jgi:hypothetical protein